MKNELRTALGDPISFAVYHEEDGEPYSLGEGEKYRLKIKRSLNDDIDDALSFDSETAQFDVPSNALSCGMYYFEISLVSSSGVETVISPATDTDGNRNNTLYITERL